MKFIGIIIIVSAILLGCATSDELPPVSQIEPSSAEEGTLANDQLIADTTAGLIEFANIQPDAKIVKFVIQHPVGSAGQRTWREIWVVSPEGNAMQFMVTFKEAGLYAADFEIQRMLDK